MGYLVGLTLVALISFVHMTMNMDNVDHSKNCLPEELKEEEFNCMMFYMSTSIARLFITGMYIILLILGM